jgi:hypothetical protein
MKKNYSDLLKSPKWQKKRLEIMKRDKFRCKLCGDTEISLQVHHKEYINGNAPWEYENSQLVTLCEHCHNEVTKIQKDGYSFDGINIYKSNNWQDGSRIMFVSVFEMCSMTIYNSEGKFIDGYNLNWEEVRNIIKVLKKAL